MSRRSLAGWIRRRLGLCGRGAFLRSPAASIQMRSRRFAVGLVLAGATIVGVVGSADHGEDDLVEKLMEKTHDGKKSPYPKVRAQVEAPSVDWKLVGAAVPRFEAMSRALLASEDDDVRSSADGYVSAVAEIAAAVGKRDRNALGRGFQSLRASCGDCHFKGGVGGKLDD